MQIGFIQPRGGMRDVSRSTIGSNCAIADRMLWFPPGALLAISSLIPKGLHDVKWLDENVSPLDFRPLDVVFMSAMTHSAARVYEIADAYRAAGTRVVVGGPHAIAVPAEVARHADATVACEGEVVWDRLWDDIEHDRLRQQVYRSDALTDPRDFAPLDHEVAAGALGAYALTKVLYTTRGCPFRCDFCFVSTAFGMKFRCRPIDAVVREVEALKGLPPANDMLAFLDDNTFGNPAYAKSLLKRLAPLRVKWCTEGSLNVARDDELIELAAAAGCLVLFVGIESINAKALRSMNKRHNRVEDYHRFIERLQAAGILVMAGFIFGTDEDDDSVFEETIAFVAESGIVFPFFSIYTPLPGTPLFSRLAGENRITSYDWSRYDLKHCVFRPHRMSPATLEQGFRYVRESCYSEAAIARRREAAPLGVRLIARGIEEKVRRVTSGARI